MTEPFTLHLGKCEDVLKTLPENSVDSIVTDPPYELGFMGKGWDRTGIANNVAMWAECLRVLKPGGHLLAFSGSRTYHRMACAIEDAGFELRDQIMWLYGSGFPKSRNIAEIDMAGDDAERWAGWGTALKPAHEPICVARKPLVGTVAANVLEHGTGALNIGACRVATDETLRAGAGGIPCRHDENVPRGRSGEASAERRYTEEGGTNFAMKPGPRGGDPAGRWPANVIHDGSEEVLDAFAHYGEKGAAAPVHRRNGDKFRTAYGAFAGNIDEAGSTFHGDAGTAARFFYCAKATRKDRNEGCEHMESKPLHWSSGDQNPGSFQSEGTDKTSPNNHPTVKPTELMAYLCRLVTPPGGLVLDPFMGSGSTGKACAREGFRFLGIDMTPPYVDIARARITHELAKIEAARAAIEPPPPQLDLFGAAA